MKKLRVTFLIILTFQLAAYAQHDFGVKASGGVSYVSGKADICGFKITDFYRPSGQAGLFYNFHIGTKWLLGAEVLFSQVGSKSYQKYITSCPAPGPFTLYEFKITGYTSYLSVPVYFGYTIKRFNINLGVQTSFVLINKAQREAIRLYDGRTTESDIKQYIKDYDFGPRIGCMYQFTKRFAIEAMYYHGVTNISTDPDYNTISRIQQILIGLRYTIVAKSQDDVKAE